MNCVHFRYTVWQYLTYVCDGGNITTIRILNMFITSEACLMPFRTPCLSPLLRHLFDWDSDSLDLLVFF